MSVNSKSESPLTVITDWINLRGTDLIMFSIVSQISFEWILGSQGHSLRCFFFTLPNREILTSLRLSTGVVR